MKLLYGVVGEGMGHAMRSRVVLEHLLQRGHEVEIVASSRARDYLAERFREVHRIHGFHVITEENRVRRGRTLWSNALKGAAAIPRQIRSYFDLIDDFEPDAVISDFESWTYFYAKAHRLPVFSIDNMQIINRCSHPPEVLEGERVSFEVARAFVKAKLPFCDHYFITTFFRPEIRKPHTSLHPPILRPEILSARARVGEHLLIYQTAEGHRALADVLRGMGVECRIYGMKRHLDREEVDANLRYRPFDEKTFVEDLASARGVLAGGGFTLMGECVYLHKPMLAVPIQGYVEQLLNARYLQREGFGRLASHVDRGVLEEFLAAIPGCRERLEGYAQDGNRDLLDALDGHLARVVR